MLAINVCVCVSVSLVGPATSIIFVATNVCLSRQKLCHDKHIFVAINICDDKHNFVATNKNLSFVTTKVCLAWQKLYASTKVCLSRCVCCDKVLSRQATLSRQEFCHGRHILF